jgi:7,8-dihydropterin-6-yl-methyl-4-(beta-D-ribofuranosyl)aminobenzene 5'-phosphate synthase
VASKHTKITILVDNHALDQSVASIREGGGLVSEHGLSFWVESGGKIVLFDTGRGPALQKNAPALGIDLEATDYLVLSHGHYDHTGGVPQALSEASEVEVYCHPGVLRTRYVIKDKKVKSIGIPRRPRKALRKLPSGRLHWVLGPSMLTDSIGITGPVPRLTDYEDTG